MGGASLARRLRPVLAGVSNDARNVAIWRHRPAGLPDVTIIGAQKAGTTSLFAALAAHPGIVPSRMKEVHFLDRNWRRGKGWYARCFPVAPGLRLEATPNYLFYPHAAARMAETAPDTRLIVLLRDPVRRALSQHRYETRRGGESRSFDEAVAQEAARTDADWTRALSDPGHWTFGLQHHSYLRRGQYGDHLRRWLKVFPKERVLLLEDSALYADPGHHLERIGAFLGIDGIADLDLPRKNVTAESEDHAGPAHLYRHFEADLALLRADWGLTPYWAPRIEAQA